MVIHNIPANYHESDDFKNMMWSLVKFISTYGHSPKSAPRQDLTGPILIHYCIECEAEVHDIILKEIFYCIGADGFSKDTISYVSIYVFLKCII